MAEIQKFAPALQSEIYHGPSRCLDKLDSIIDSNEKVLLFTRFTEMGRLLEQFIADRYGDKPLYYHGGCGLNQRKEMVERFRTNRPWKPPFLAIYYCAPVLYIINVYIYT